MSDAVVEDEIQLLPESDKDREYRIWLEKTKEQVNDLPKNGIVRLGPKTPGAVKKFVALVTFMLRHNIKPPRSRFAQYVAARVTGKDKQDFSMIITGRKGSGKSYSSLRICQQIAEEIAENLGGKAEDYFSMGNCCLLEDTDGINKLIKRMAMHQVILIDDAGVAVGSRDFATTNNKNFNKIIATCRTKRWVIILNTPAKTHVDKQIREMVDCWAHVFMSAHEQGFNILKINSISINEHAGNKLYQKRYEFEKLKVDMWAVLSPPEDVVARYDEGRAAAAQKLIDAMVDDDEKPKMNKTEERRQELLTKYSEKIVQMANDGASNSAMVRACPGVSDAVMRRLRAELGV